MKTKLTRLCIGFPNTPCGIEFTTWAKNCFRCEKCRKVEHSNTMKRMWKRMKKEGWKPKDKMERIRNKTKDVFCIGLPWKECEIIINPQTVEECRCLSCEEAYQKELRKEYKRRDKVRRHGKNYNMDENFDIIIYYC